MLDASKYTSKDQMYMDQMLAQVVSHEHDNWLMLAGGQRVHIFNRAESVGWKNLHGGRISVINSLLKSSFHLILSSTPQWQNR